jgi:hypothetical protein
MNNRAFSRARRAIERHNPGERSVSRSRFADGITSFAEIFPVRNLNHARQIANRDGGAVDEANLLRDWRAVGHDISVASERFSQQNLPDDCEP